MTAKDYLEYISNIIHTTIIAIVVSMKALTVFQVYKGSGRKKEMT